MQSLAQEKVAARPDHCKIRPERYILKKEKGEGV